MQFDQVYLKGLLEAFQSVPGPLTDIDQLAAAGFPYSDPQFVFHMEILDDKGLIAQPYGDPGFGLFRGINGTASWSVLPLRLTASGHDFLEVLRDKRIWATIQRDFKSAGITTLLTIEKQSWRNMIGRMLVIASYWTSAIIPATHWATGLIASKSLCPLLSIGSATSRTL